jgi:Ca2+-binding EF-hand superfamily protein
MCVCLGLSQAGIAGPREIMAVPEVPDDRFAQPSDEAGNEQLQSLSGVSIEERMRLRMDLNHYSRTSDPIHSKIEDRRRIMSKDIQDRYFRADKDNDGLLSRQEVVDSLPQVARHYNQVDLDSDGFISIKELVAFQAKLIERQYAAELRMQQAREAELEEARKAEEAELEEARKAEEAELSSKQTRRPKIKSKQAEVERKPAL